MKNLIVEAELRSNDAKLKEQSSVIDNPTSNEKRLE
jgi:hypothetical protein